MRIVISPADAGCTAGDFLKRKVKLSAAQISSLKFRENGICINGKRVRITQILQEGDCLELLMEDKTCGFACLVPVEHPLQILYEDEDLVCVWKEAGMVLHPAHGHYCDSLANYLQAYFMKKGEQVQMRSIGRLDRDTSGIVVFAKNKIAAARLWQQRQSGIFQKEYVALCEGVFPEEAYEREMTVDVPIAKMPGHKNKMCAVVRPSVSAPSVSAPSVSAPVADIFSASAPHCAVTHYQAIRKEHGDFPAAMQIFSGENNPQKAEMQLPGGDDAGQRDSGQSDARQCNAGQCDAGQCDAGQRDARQCDAGHSRTTLVRLHLETGRTHQIRVHMAYIGHPLVGDAVYGNGTAGQTYAKLCAWRAKLVQPFTGEKIFLHPPFGI